MFFKFNDIDKSIINLDTIISIKTYRENYKIIKIETVKKTIILQYENENILKKDINDILNKEIVKQPENIAQTIISSGTAGINKGIDFLKDKTKKITKDISKEPIGFLFEREFHAPFVNIEKGQVVKVIYTDGAYYVDNPIGYGCLFKAISETGQQYGKLIYGE